MPKTRARKSNLFANQKDNTVVDIDDKTHDSGDEVSQTPKSKRMRGLPSFVGPEFESRFFDMELGTRAIIIGAPISGKLVPGLTQCGVLKLFQDIGIEGFMLDLPKVYYPDLVREYYANLHVDKFGNVLSSVSGKKIQLNPPVLSSILHFEFISEVDVYTAQGAVSLHNFSVVDQLYVLFGSVKPMDMAPPATTIVSPLAHLVFKFVRSHLCPRLGNKSNFTNQDVIACAMILSGKSFDVSSLILQKMVSTIEKAVTGIPYAQVLTKIFEFFKVDVKTASKVVVKEVFDNKALGQNNLHIEDGVLSRLLPPLDTLIHEPVTSAEPVSVAPNLFSQSLHADISIMTGEITSLRSDSQVIRNDVQSIKAYYQTIKGALKEFISEMKAVKELMLKSAGVSSATHSAMEEDVGLEGLADAAQKEAEEHDTEATKTDGVDLPKDS